MSLLKARAVAELDLSLGSWISATIGLVYQMIGLSWVAYILIAAAVVAAIYALRLYKNIER